jgi:hypothetical protein
LQDSLSMEELAWWIKRAWRQQSVKTACIVLNYMGKLRTVERDREWRVTKDAAVESLRDSTSTNLMFVNG